MLQSMRIKLTRKRQKILVQSVCKKKKTRKYTRHTIKKSIYKHFPMASSKLIIGNVETIERDYSAGIRQNITITRPIEIKASAWKSQIYAHLGLRNTARWSRPAWAMIPVSEYTFPLLLSLFGFRTCTSQYAMMNCVDWKRSRVLTAL